MEKIKFSKPVSASFDEIGIPNIIYKYRDWSRQNHKRILLNRELYFAKPESFEDEFDCKIPIRYDLLTDSDISNHYYKILNQDYPNLPVDELIKLTCYWVDKGLMKDIKRLKDLDKENWTEFNLRFGVLSVTALRDNYEMWNAYSNSFQGICVGFNSSLLFSNVEVFGAGGPVIYDKDFPLITPIMDLMEQHWTQIYFKLLKWSFEKEYRLTKSYEKFFPEEKRKVAVPPEAILEIIIGYKMPDEQIKEVTKIKADNFPLAKLFIAKVMEDKTVSIEEIY